MYTTNAVKSGLDEHLETMAYAGNYSLRREDDWYTLRNYTQCKDTLVSGFSFSSRISHRKWLLVLTTNLRYLPCR